VPDAGHFFPIGDVGCSSSRQRGKRYCDFRQWNANPLRHFDDGYPPEYVSLIATLIAAVSHAFDQSLAFIKMQRRYGNAAALGNLAHREQFSMILGSYF